MAAPNLKQPVTITGKTATYNCTATLAVALSNAAASGKVLKVNTVRAANIDTSLNIAFDLTVYRGSTHSYIASAITIPVASTLIALSKEEYIYLEEGDAIYAKSGVAGKIDLTIGYEEIA